MRPYFVAIIITLSLSIALFGQDTLNKGAWELGAYTGGAKSIQGGAPGTHDYWMIGGRWSRVMTEFGGGAFEYGVEVYPALVDAQTKTTYAYGFSPLQLRYNFASHHKVVPFFEIGGGILGSSQQLPENTYRFNFIDQGGIGLQFMRKSGPSITTGMKYQHISNAGLGNHNPGINSLFFYGGLSWWKK